MSEQVRGPGASAEREHWGGSAGFVLAAVGSAVGLGNMWRFSYVAAENGGAAFVALYLLMTFGVGLPVLLAELVMGRGAQRGPIGALIHYCGSAWRPLGLLFIASSLLILSYYCVIAGWTFRYAVTGIASGFEGDAAARFAGVAEGAGAVFWHLAFVALSLTVVLGGVRRGIERCAVVAMPALFLVVVGLAIYAATLDGASAGYRYYLEMDFGELFSADVFLAAAGQAFFSLSLGGGLMMTYASYLERTHPVAGDGVTIALSDFGVAFVAGLVVFPLIFALGLQTEVGESTVGALFITLPRAFQEMGGAGRVVGVLFFVALVVGALTSVISMLELLIVNASEELGWSRRRSCWAAAVAVGGLGIFSALDTDWLGLLDLLASNVLLLAGGLGTAVAVGFASRSAREEASDRWWSSLWVVALRWVTPPVLLFALGHALVGFWGALLAYLSSWTQAS